MNLSKTLQAGLASLAIFGASAQAQTEDQPAQEKGFIRLGEEKKPVISNVYANTGFYSEYVGILGFSGSDGRPVVQSDFGFDVKGISLNTWFNYDSKKGLNEIDQTIAKRFDTKYFAIAPGVLGYTFPGTQMADALVPTVGLYSKTLPIDLRLNVYKAFGRDSHDGTYAQFGAGKTFSLIENRLNLALEGRVNYNDHFFVLGSGFQSVAGDVTVNINLGKGWTVSPTFRAQKTIDPHNGCFKDDLMGGLRLGWRY
jgi:hypothetical protein